MLADDERPDHRAEPRRTGGCLVAFLAGDDADAKATVSAFADSMGFAPVDLGGLHDAGRLMQVGGGPLSGFTSLSSNSRANLAGVLGMSRLCGSFCVVPPCVTAGRCRPWFVLRRAFMLGLA